MYTRLFMWVLYSSCVGYHALSYAVSLYVMLLCRTQPRGFCLQDVLTDNPPVRARQSCTLCSHCRSPSLSVCLHSSIYPGFSVFLFGCRFLADFRSDPRPTIGLLCQRHSCTSLVSGTGNPRHHLPSVAFITTHTLKLTDTRVLPLLLLLCFISLH